VLPRSALKQSRHRQNYRGVDDFCHASDPYEEHDFGSFEVDGPHGIF
jgi:hypothetical protein